MPLEFVDLEDLETVADLRVYLTRARAVEDGAVRLQAAGRALAVYVPVLYPEELGAAVPTILGLRVAGLADAVERLDAVYPLAALADRLARMEGTSTRLDLPPAEVFAAWAGTVPPRGGWERQGEYDDGALRSAAEDGMRAVAAALPENSGRPVLATVRSRIWASPAPVDGAGALPAGACFAAETLGFLRPEGTTGLYAAGRWLRLSATGGHVLVKPPA